MSFYFADFSQLFLHFEHLLFLHWCLLFYCLVETPQQRHVVLQQTGVHDTYRFIKDLELMPQSHLINPQLALLRHIGGDLLLKEVYGRINAFNIAHILIILFLLGLRNVHAGIEAGKALHYLRASQQCNAFWVAIHNILGEIWSIILAKVELVEHALPRGLLIFFIKHCGRILYSIMSMWK